MDILEKLDDLIVQATSERSHYYVRSVCEEARKEIVRLNADCRVYGDALRRWNKERDELKAELNWWHELIHKYHSNHEKGNLRKIVQSFIDENERLWDLLTEAYEGLNSPNAWVHTEFNIKYQAMQKAQALQSSDPASDPGSGGK